jgi:hypothetical protein
MHRNAPIDWLTDGKIRRIKLNWNWAGLLQWNEFEDDRVYHRVLK